jgi:hypothetical protein
MGADHELVKRELRLKDLEKFPDGSRMKRMFEFVDQDDQRILFHKAGEQEDQNVPDPDAGLI